MSSFYDENMPEVIEEARRLIPHFKEVLEKYGQDGLVQYVYDYVDEILEKGGLHKVTTCGKSGTCSFCCHSTIYMSKFEKEYIRKYAKLNNIKPDKQRVKLQNNNTEQQLKWVDRACPFLSSTDGKGKCTIYELRPLVCRTHNSLEDPNKCMKEKDPTVKISEGRIIQSEACMIALNMMSSENIEFPKLIPIHKVTFKN